MLTVRIMRHALATLGFCALLVCATSAYAAETADWLPLKGTYSNAIGCTWGDSGGCSGVHTGGPAIDFIVPVGTPVYAAGPGTVTSYGGCDATNSPGCNGGAGNYIVVSHPDGRQSRYLHLKSRVKTSGSVSRGALIGYSGNSGGSSVAHLHYDELVNGSRVDPGPMKAVHGTSLKQYPQALGYDSWSSVPAWGNHTVRNDAFKPPVSGMPFGHFDILQRAPGGARIAGWAIDPNAANAGKGPIYVDTYGGSGSPGGGNPGRRLTANLYRPDVGKAYPKYGSYHGYDGKISLPYGSHKVCSYAINVGPGSHKQIGCKSINISPDPFGRLDTVKPVDGGIQVSGWAIDPDTASPIRVDTYGGDGGAAPGVNPGHNFTANVSRPDVKRVHPNYGDLHGYAGFFPLKSGQQTVCAYAINASGTTGANKKIGCKTVTVP